MDIGLVGNQKYRECPESRRGKDFGTFIAPRVLREWIRSGSWELAAK